jgi:hypothetical protein
MTAGPVLDEDVAGAGDDVGVGHDDAGTHDETGSLMDQTATGAYDPRNGGFCHGRGHPHDRVGRQRHRPRRCRLEAVEHLRKAERAAPTANPARRPANDEI